MSVLALFVGLLMAPPTASAAPDEQRQPASPEDRIDPEVLSAFDTLGAATFWVRFDQRADTSTAAETDDWTERGQQVVDALKSTAASSQSAVRTLLDARNVIHTPYWITNAILVKDGTEDLAHRLAGMAGVSRLTAQQAYTLPPPAEQSEATLAAQGVEWGVANINADDVWNQYGVRGEGVVVANIDSGVGFEHPALVESYRGTNADGTFDHDYNWFDSSGTCGGQPCDGAGNSHGTHTMGTMVGDDGAGNQIGVAPRARWIAANGCNTCLDADLIASGQWLLAPTDLNGQNPDVSRRPHVVNNSWGSTVPSTEPFMEDIVNAFTDAGIFAVWSNGNDGALGCRSSGSPGSRIATYSVGAYDENNELAWFSARGSGQDGETKPNITAPGVAVRSSLKDGSYGLISGTSMAAPHVAGAVALAWSAAPELVGDVERTRELLDQTAIDVEPPLGFCGGSPEDNNWWGEGRLDALALVEAAQDATGDSGVLQGTVTDAGTGEPLSGATLSVAGTAGRTTTTDADGTFSLVLPVGGYEATVSMFGFTSVTQEVDITADGTATFDSALAVADTFPVSGTVTAADSGAPLAGITVTVEDSPVPAVTTDADGHYTLPAVPAGTHEVRADGGRRCVATQVTPLTVDGAETLDVAMPRIRGSFGYYCVLEPADYVEAANRLDFSGPDVSTAVELPFTFPLYGNLYTTAHLSSNGHISLAAPSTAPGNTRIPNQAAPNAAIYHFWDDLFIDGESGVFTETFGTAPNREFVIEIRNTRPFLERDKRFDVEVTLHENGDIDLTYRNLDADQPRELGADATVGIENAAGTEAFEYSSGEPALSNDRQISFRLPPAGYVTGTVTDANDGNPVVGATVTATRADGTVAHQVETDEQGRYGMQLLAGAYSIQPGARGYVTGAHDLVINTDQEHNTVDFAMRTGIAQVDAPELAWLLAEDEARSAEVTITNTGSADLSFDFGEVRAAGPGDQATADSGGGAGLSATADADPAARDTRGLFPEEQTTAAEPMAAGDVLDSWEADVGLAWGVGATLINERLWISSPPAATNTEFTPDGTPTGREFVPDWVEQPSGWGGDMAFEPLSGSMCQVNVTGDNAIHCWDPATGEDNYVITPDWTRPQRGLAYNEVADVFYAGSWLRGERKVYTVAGRTHDSPGEVLATCFPEEGSISGLAYNSSADVLWEVTNTRTSTIFQLDPSDCSTISSMGFPGDPAFAGAGAALDSAGNLWVTNQNDNTMYLLDTDVPRLADLPWLSQDPASGTLVPGESTSVAVTVDTSDLDAGVYNASIVISTSAGRDSRMRIPLSLVVSDYRVGVNVGGGEYVDTRGDTWQPDQQYADGGWGWVGQRTQTSTTERGIGGTEDDTLYQDRRSGIVTYQFDNVPAGTYQIELCFAEYRRNAMPWRRVFDATVNGQVVLFGHDVAAEVRGLWADRHSVVVEHTGGTLTVRLHDRFGYRLPILNALRVTERPDL